MRNRAKCKLCEDIIESFHRHDYVTCKCGEISVDGGMDYCRCAAKNWENFLRIDDLDNVIVPKVVDKVEDVGVNAEKHPEEFVKKPNKKELIEMLDVMRENIEKLPSHAMTAPINHYDFVSLLMLLSSIFKTKK